MKKFLGALAVSALALTGLAAGGTAQAAPPAICSPKTVAKGYICNPNGETVKKLPPLERVGVSNLNSRVQSPERVAKKVIPAPAPPSVKAAQASCTLPAACMGYNGGRQIGMASANNVAGASVNMKIGGQTGTAGTASANNRGSDGYHTLMETAVQGVDNGDTVEVGAIQGLGVNGGAQQSRPFVFYWVNGFGQGYNGGQFVPVSGSTFVPGVTNLTANACYETEIWHDSNQLVWWTAFNACGAAKNWMGYYADDVWTDSTKWQSGTPATPTAAFTEAENVQMYAESATTVDHPCTDLGNGLIASNANAASFTGIKLLNQVNRSTITGLTNFSTFRSPTATTGSTYSNTYSLGPAGAQTGFRVGGPQWDKATGTVTGIVGC